jgi:hypothetical protein
MTQNAPTSPEKGRDVDSHIVEWPGCSGCSAIAHDSQCRVLAGGVIVCSTCPDATLEDEARRLLAKPLVARREALQDMERRGLDGIEQANRLRRVMREIHARVKNGRHQQK